MKNLGTKIERIAKPIARGIDAIWGSDLATCGGCGNMRDNLNAGMSVQDAIIERWFKAKEKGEKMKYKATVVVVADTATKAAEKIESIGDLLGMQAVVEQDKVAHTGIQTSGQFSKTTTQPS